LVTQPATRVDTLAELNGRTFDVAIIGGGINGAGVARDAALRGLSVCLFEQGDFAGGTSSKSTKIAHGGLRYLRNFEFGLVRESQRERLILRRLLPHLVQPQSFCYPVYRDSPDSYLKVRIGVGVYTLLGGLKERSAGLQPEAAIAANPYLRRDGLTGAVRYWDDRMDDARICLETILSAEEAGAVCLNYTPVVAVRRSTGGLFELSYQTSEGGGSVRARAIVNCSGPWTDHVLGGLLRSPGRRLAPTKGVHIVVPRIEGEDALILDNRRDNRTFFAIPWDDATLIGTTDTRYDGDPAGVRVEQEDIDYLIDAASYYLPGANLKASDVIHSFAGLRPLVAPGDEGVSEGRISRRHRVLVEPQGVVTLIGGKYTTFRSMTKEATDAVVDVLGGPRRPCTTERAAYFPTMAPTTDSRAEPELWSQLMFRYGPRAAAVYDLCMSDPVLREPVLPGYNLRLGELVFSIRHEKALTMDDLIYRRTRLAWRKDLTSEALQRIRAALEPYASLTIPRAGIAD
jgi:glycerol-3-phosphate dehydrogenase